MRENELRKAYLDLLKKSLTDLLHLDNPYANAMPLSRLRLASPLKRWRNKILERLAARSHILLSRADRLTLEERRERRVKGTDWPPLAETMIGMARLDNIEKLAETILAESVPGDFIETGVWRGGATIFMSALLKTHDVKDRRIWACDSFAGLPPPDAKKYPADAGDTHHEISFLAVGLEDVKENFRKYGLLDDRVRFVEGFFEKTLPSLRENTFALLRIDGDMYGSTFCALENLYPRLSPGGFVIIDDYHAIGACKKAVGDFRKREGLLEPIEEIDGTGIYWRKA